MLEGCHHYCYTYYVSKCHSQLRARRVAVRRSREAKCRAERSLLVVYIYAIIIILSIFPFIPSLLHATLFTLLRH